MSDQVPIIVLAAEVAARLDYTTDDLALFCERVGNERYGHCSNDLDFCRELDRLIFMCKTCEYWKPQRENATPDDGQWQCKECFAEDHP